MRSLFISGFALIIAIILSFFIPDQEHHSTLASILQETKYVGNTIGAGFLRGAINLWDKTRLPVLNGTLDVEGLKENVEVIRDKFGIPHIYAKNEIDMLFAQGFVHAQDRLWQMDVHRRLASGKLSQYFGEMALHTDRITRTLGFQRKASNDVLEISPKAKAFLQAYADGINAYMNSTWFRLPIEHSIIGISQVEPWKIEDSLTFFRCLAWQMSKGWAMEITRQILYDTIGEDKAAELEPRFRETMPVHVPMGIEVNTMHIAEEKDTFFAQDGGSNAWAISGNKTTTKKPLMSNDLHLALTSPSIWYENHIVGGDYDVIGASIPAIGLIIVGHNNRIAWGITLANTDSDDLFVEKFIQYPETYEYKGKVLNATLFEEKIYVKGRDQPHIETVIETVHGPLISSIFDIVKGDVAISSLSIKTGPSFDSAIDICKSNNWNEFKNAVHGTAAPALNFIYSDVDGNIGTLVSGRIPIRGNGHKGMFPVIGWSGEYDWQGWVPLEEMPHQLNPARGFVASCNNPLADNNYKWFLGNSFTNAYRAQRVVEFLQSKDIFTPEDFVRLQMDVTSIAGREFASRIINMGLNKEDSDIRLAIEILSEWDGQMTKETVAGSMYHVIKRRAMFNLLEPHLGENITLLALGKGFHPVIRAASEYIGFDITTLFRMIDNDSSWWMNAAGGPKKLMEKSVKEGIEWLRNRFGDDATEWRWERLHRIAWKHTLGAKTPLDFIFNVGPIGHDGDFDTPKMSASLAGTFDGFGWNPTFRQIVDLSDVKNSQSVHAPGQSGHVASKHFDDFVDLWLHGEMHPMLTERESFEAEGIITLQKMRSN